MDFTSDVLVDMGRKKAKYNPKLANYYYSMYRSSGGKIEKIYDTYTGKYKLVPVGGDVAYFRRGDRIASCCDLWRWDVYEKNKIMDLKKLNRCMNSRFCPNCKMLSVAKFLHEFSEYYKGAKDDYDWYMLTSTIPSVVCDGEILRDTIDRLYKSFRKLNHKYSAPLVTDAGKLSKQALQSRLIEISGGVRVLEITHNARQGMHPHLHAIVVAPKGSVRDVDLAKVVQGKYSRKRQSYNYKSALDMQLAKAWTMIWYGIDFRLWDKVDYDPKETYLVVKGEKTEYKCLEVDLVPLDRDGIFEVFKYTIKSSDITSVRVFSALVSALYGKRIRQGFGVLHNIKCEDDGNGEYQGLDLVYDEEPIEILTREFNELLTTYADYRKISRYNPVDKYDVATRVAD